MASFRESLEEMFEKRSLDLELMMPDDSSFVSHVPDKKPTEVTKGTSNFGAFLKMLWEQSPLWPWYIVMFVGVVLAGGKQNTP